MKILKTLNLTAMQKGLLFHSISNKSDEYLEQIFIELLGFVNLDYLTQSIYTVCSEYDILHSLFAFSKVEDPKLVVVDELKPQVDIIFLEGDDNETVSEFLQADRKKLFHLEKGPLIRFTLLHNKETTYMVMTFHHILLDGWSLNEIMKRLLLLYSSYYHNTIPEIQRDFALERNSEFLESFNYQGAKNYFKQNFQDYEVPEKLPSGFFNNSQIIKHLEHEHTFSAEATNEIIEFCKNKSVTVSSFVHAAVLFAVQFCCDADDVAIGSVLSGREKDDLEINDGVGLFINLLPIRATFNPDLSLEQFLKDMSNAYINLSKYQYAGLDQILEWVGKKELFNVILAFENYPLDSQLAHRMNLPFQLGKLKSFEKTNYDLAITATLTEKLKLTCLHKMNPKYVHRFVETMEKFMNWAVCDSGNGKVMTIPMSEGVVLTNLGVGDSKKSHVIERFKDVVGKVPEKTAIFSGNERVTYLELDRLSDHFGAVLQRRGVKAGDRLCICVEKNIDAVALMLAILKIGAVYIPVISTSDRSQISYILKDADVSALVDFTKDQILKNKMDCRMYLEKDCFAIEEVVFKLDFQEFREEAYIIYTSGTTGTPKGVVIGQHSISRIAYDTDYINITQNDIIYQLSSMQFDGSVFDIYGALLNGAALFMDESQATTIDRIAENIIEYEISIFFITTALFNELVDFRSDVFESQKLRCVLFGGEISSVAHTKKCLERYKGSLVHVYGPTENTVFSTYFSVTKEYLINFGLTSIPIGIPIKGTECYVVDRHLNILPDGVIGELLLAGEGLAEAYIETHKEYNEKFIFTEKIPGKRLYKTGDRVRILEDYTIEFIGRRDGQVKIKGYRIDLAEVTSRLENIDGIERVFVTTQKNDSFSTLVAYLVLSQDLTEKQLAEKCREELPYYMVPGKLIRVPCLVLNINGKVDANAMLDYLEKYDDQKLIINKDEEAFGIIAEMWKRVLKVDSVNNKTDFFVEGGESLKAMKMCAEVKKRIGIDITVADVFSHTIYGEFCEFIEEKRDSVEASKDIEDAQQYCQLSPQQYSILLDQEANPEKTVLYNIPVAFTVRGTLDKERIDSAFQKIMKAHPVFKLRVCRENGEYVQRIDACRNLKVLYQNVKKRDIEKILVDLNRPFDIFRDILIRVSVLFDSENSETTIMIDVHHIICDGISIGNIVKEFMELYQDSSSTITEEKHYFSYVNEMKLMEDYVHTVPKDWYKINFHDEVSGENSEAEYIRTLDKEVSARVEEAAKRLKTTKYIIYMAGFHILLSKYSGQKEITVLSTYSDQIQKGYADTIGMYANTILINSEIDMREQFCSYIRTLTQNVRDIMVNNIPYMYLVQIMREQGIITNTDYPNIMFTMDDVDLSGEVNRIEGLDICKIYPPKVHDNKFELLCAVNTDIGHVRIEYDNNKLTAETIKNMMDHYEVTLTFMLSNMEKEISSLHMFSDSDQNIWEKYNQVPVANRNGDLAYYYREVLNVNWNKTAVIDAYGSITFGELDKMSDYYADIISSNIVYKNSDIVPFYAGRRIHSVVALLAILKLGKTYVPVSDTYPKERKAYIAEVCGVSECFVPEYLEPEQIPEVSTYEWKIDGEKLAYIIFTSGTTGYPKGVQIKHNSVLNTVLAVNELIKVDSNDVLMCVSSFGFDLSVYDVFAMLSTGATLVIAEDASDTRGLIKLAEEYKVTIWNSVPAIYDLFLHRLDLLKERGKYKKLYLKNVMLGGDYIPLELYDESKKNLPDAELFSMGGTTEGSIWSIYYPILKVEENWKTIPYGNPLPGQCIYVLDSELRLQSVNIAGEIAIGGEGVAVGYLGDEEKTKKQFISHKEFGDIYLTGDYGIMRKDGFIEFLGRRDEQIKINGFRIELKEVEKQIQLLPYVDKAVVSIYENNIHQKLMASFVKLKANRQIDEDDIRKDLSKSLTQYMIPKKILIVDDLLYSMNGKVDKKQLVKLLEVHQSDEQISEVDNEKLDSLTQDIWNRINKCAVKAGSGELMRNACINDGLMQIGYQSLDIIKLSSVLSEHFQIDISFRKLLDLGTPKALIKYLGENSKPNSKQARLDKKYENTSEIELNNMQLAYLFGKSSKFRAAANGTSLFSVLKFKGNIDLLEKSLQTVIMFQPALRSTVNKKARQLILQRVPEYQVKRFGYDGHKLSKEDFEALKNEVEGTVFGINEWPYFRIEAVLYEEQQYLLVCVDPMFIDGESLGLLQQQIFDVYEGKKLEPLKYSIIDYHYDMENTKENQEYLECKNFWENKISDFPSNTFEFPIVGDESQGRRRLYIEGQQYTKLLSYAKRNNVSISALILTIYKQAISELFSEERMVINVTTMNRIPFHTDLQRVIGEFTNIILCDFDTENIDFGKELKKVSHTLTEHVKNRMYDGMEVMRLLSKKKGSLGKQIYPFVFTSFISSGNFRKESKYIDYTGGISRTSQVFIDHQVISENDGLLLIWDYNRAYMREDIMDEIERVTISRLQKIDME